MQAHLAESLLSPAPHVIKKLLCPVYEGFCVQAVIPQDPPAVLTVATEAALQPLQKPATSTIPVMFGRRWLSQPTSRARFLQLDQQGMMKSTICIFGTRMGA